MWAAMGATLDARDGAFDGAAINRTGHTKGYAGSREDGSSYADIGDYVVYRQNAGPDDTDQPPRRTRPVGSKLANELGLRDMNGNVWEWTGDWRASYPSGPLINPTGAESGSTRVIRGGSWFDNVLDCTVAGRSDEDPHRGLDRIGFRVASR